MRTYFFVGCFIPFAALAQSSGQIGARISGLIPLSTYADRSSAGGGGGICYTYFVQPDLAVEMNLDYMGPSGKTLPFPSDHIVIRYGVLFFTRDPCLGPAIVCGLDLGFLAEVDLPKRKRFVVVPRLTVRFEMSRDIFLDFGPHYLTTFGGPGRTGYVSIDAGVCFAL